MLRSLFSTNKIKSTTPKQRTQKKKLRQRVLTETRSPGNWDKLRQQARRPKTAAVIKGSASVWCHTNYVSNE